MIFAATLLSFPVFERSLRAYHKTFFQSLKNFKNYHDTAMTPGAGNDDVPIRAAQVRDMVKQYQLQNYRLSVEYSKEPWSYQQTIVSNWPIKLESESKDIFQLPSEPVSKDCKLINSTSVVALVHCN